MNYFTFISVFECQFDSWFDKTKGTDAIDVAISSLICSLREEKNGQTIIRSFEDVAFNMDERMDSEDEELEQSRIDLKREIKHLNRRNANVTPILTK